jgi:hypothetical protein
MKPLFTLFISSLIVSGMALGQGGKSVFLELGGNGLGFSANFDARFTKAEKGLGFRAGFGFLPGVSIGGNDDPTFFSWPTILSIPVGLNFLLGKAPNYFEVGLGATYFYGRGRFTFFFLPVDSTLSTFMFIPSAGYRFAKPGKSFQGRAFISPYIFSGGVSFFAGVSGGIKF